MIVYVIEKFTDFESSHIIKAFKDKEMAFAFCLEEIKKIHKTDFHKEDIENLPTGYRTGDTGYIFNALEVV
jgi:hypothetical protein